MGSKFIANKEGYGFKVYY